MAEKIIHITKIYLEIISIYTIYFQFLVFSLKFLQYDYFRNYTLAENIEILTHKEYPLMQQHILCSRKETLRMNREKLIL